MTQRMQCFIFTNRETAAAAQWLLRSREKAVAKAIEEARERAIADSALLKKLKAKRKLTSLQRFTKCEIKYLGDGDSGVYLRLRWALSELLSEGPFDANEVDVDCLGRAVFYGIDIDSDPTLPANSKR